jgi:hypothetical protein
LKEGLLPLYVWFQCNANNMLLGSPFTNETKLFSYNVDTALYASLGRKEETAIIAQ